MNKDLRVRRAATDDAPEIVRVYVAAWNAGFVGHLPPLAADDARIARWRVDLAAARSLWWVADVGGNTVGVVGIGPSRDPVDPDVGELDTVAVAPSHWRRGVGSALMEVADEALQAFPRAILWTLADYPLAQSFYAAHGWRPDGATRDGGRQVRFTR